MKKTALNDSIDEDGWEMKNITESSEENNGKEKPKENLIAEDKLDGDMLEEDLDEVSEIEWGCESEEKSTKELPISLAEVSKTGKIAIDSNNINKNRKDVHKPVETVDVEKVNEDYDSKHKSEVNTDENLKNVLVENTAINYNEVSNNKALQHEELLHQFFRKEPNIKANNNKETMHTDPMHEARTHEGLSRKDVVLGESNNEEKSDDKSILYAADVGAPSSKELQKDIIVNKGDASVKISGDKSLNVNNDNGKCVVDDRNTANEETLEADDAGLYTWVHKVNLDDTELSEGLIDEKIQKEYVKENEGAVKDKHDNGDCIGKEVNSIKTELKEPVNLHEGEEPKRVQQYDVTAKPVHVEPVSALKKDGIRAQQYDFLPNHECIEAVDELQEDGSRVQQYHVTPNPECIEEVSALEEELPSKAQQINAANICTERAEETSLCQELEDFECSTGEIENDIFFAKDKIDEQKSDTKNNKDEDEMDNNSLDFRQNIKDKQVVDDVCEEVGEGPSELCDKPAQELQKKKDELDHEIKETKEYKDEAIKDGDEAQNIEENTRDCFVIVDKQVNTDTKDNQTGYQAQTDKIELKELIKQNDNDENIAKGNAVDLCKQALKSSCSTVGQEHLENNDPTAEQALHSNPAVEQDQVYKDMVNDQTDNNTCTLEYNHKNIDNELYNTKEDAQLHNETNESVTFKDDMIYNEETFVSEELSGSLKIVDKVDENEIWSSEENDIFSEIRKGKEGISEERTVEQICAAREKAYDEVGQDDRSLEMAEQERAEVMAEEKIIPDEDRDNDQMAEQERAEVMAEEKRIPDEDGDNDQMAEQERAEVMVEGRTPQEDEIEAVPEGVRKHAIIEKPFVHKNLNEDVSKSINGDNVITKKVTFNISNIANKKVNIDKNNRTNLCENNQSKILIFKNLIIHFHLIKQKRVDFKTKTENEVVKNKYDFYKAIKKEIRNEREKEVEDLIKRKNEEFIKMIKTSKYTSDTLKANKSYSNTVYAGMDADLIDDFFSNTEYAINKSIKNNNWACALLFSSFDPIFRENTILLFLEKHFEKEVIPFFMFKIGIYKMKYFINLKKNWKSYIFYIIKNCDISQSTITNFVSSFIVEISKASIINALYSYLLFKRYFGCDFDILYIFIGNKFCIEMFLLFEEKFERVKDFDLLLMIYYFDSEEINKYKSRIRNEYKKYLNKSKWSFRKVVDIGISKIIGIDSSNEENKVERVSKASSNADVTVADDSAVSSNITSDKPVLTNSTNAVPKVKFYSSKEIRNNIFIPQSKVEKTNADTIENLNTKTNPLNTDLSSTVVSSTPSTDMSSTILPTSNTTPSINNTDTPSSTPPVSPFYMQKQTQSFADLFSYNNEIQNSSSINDILEGCKDDFRDDMKISKSKTDSDESKKESFFSRFFGIKKKVYKVKNESDANFVFDESTKKWINKNESDKNKFKVNEIKKEKIEPKKIDNLVKNALKSDVKIERYAGFKRNTNLNDLIPGIKKKKEM